LASILDEMMASEGVIDPDFLGINQAKCCDIIWYRERGESEAEFHARAKRDACLLGYRNICVSGHLEVGDCHQFDKSDTKRLGLPDAAS
jgi:hypothetical protein